MDDMRGAGAPWRPVTMAADRGQDKVGSAKPPASRLAAALARGESLALKELGRPVRRGGREAGHVLLLGGRAQPRCRPPE
jgi:hypothetical protein